jgi:hypothetical protein
MSVRGRDMPEKYHAAAMRAATITASPAYAITDVAHEITAEYAPLVEAVIHSVEMLDRAGFYISASDLRAALREVVGDD